MTGLPIRLGVAGLGYWGPNIARNFAELPGCELSWCCDPSEIARDRAGGAQSRTTPPAVRARRLTPRRSTTAGTRSSTAS